METRRETTTERTVSGDPVTPAPYRYDRRIFAGQMIGLLILFVVLTAVWASSFRHIPPMLNAAMERTTEPAPGPEERQVLVGQDGKRYIVISASEANQGGG